MLFGYGNSQYAASHGRPMWMSGKMPAHMTAKSVMPSAKRLIDVRQSWLSSSRIAEISVPAWPMPIHQTKLMIAKPQPIGRLMPQMPGALDQQPGDGHPQHAHEHEADGNDDEPAERRAAAQDDAADLVGDRAERVPRLDERRA